MSVFDPWPALVVAVDTVGHAFAVEARVTAVADCALVQLLRAAPYRAAVRTWARGQNRRI